MWFDCQSEVLRRERISLIPNDRPKFVHPILEKVQPISTNFPYGRVGYYMGINKWERIGGSSVEDVMHFLDDVQNYPSLEIIRKRKKLKTQ